MIYNPGGKIVTWAGDEAQDEKMRRTITKTNNGCNL